MTKFILTMFLCSQISGNGCKPFQPEYVNFKTYHECARYGYDYASELMTEFSTEFIDEYRTYIIFGCKEESTI
tara:strand:- start:507 stop:725 length:219 start_codon:yes stop_codon:yes gene_type:complete